MSPDCQLKQRRVGDGKSVWRSIHGSSYMANTPQPGNAPLSNWAKLRSDPAYRKRSAARAKIIAATGPNRDRYTPPLNVKTRFLIQNADLSSRIDGKTGEVFGESVWVQLAVADDRHPDNRRQFRYYMDLPRFTQKRDGTAATYDFGAACIKSFLMAFGVDEETASDEQAWPDLFAATIGKAITAIPRLRKGKPYRARTANPAKGINIGDSVTPPPRLYLDSIEEVLLPEGGDYPTVSDEYHNTDEHDAFDSDDVSDEADVSYDDNDDNDGNDEEVSGTNKGGVSRSAPVQSRRPASRRISSVKP